MVIPIDAGLMDMVSAQAAGSPRLRKNFNFHTSDSEKCHRLINAVEPDSYIPPHCHAAPDKDETVVVLRGRLGVLIFDDQGGVVRSFLIEPGGRNVGLTVPHGVFHTSVALARGTVFFEAKAGPYQPLQDKEKPVWAPTEGSPESSAYLGQLKARFSGVPAV